MHTYMKVTYDARLRTATGALREGRVQTPFPTQIASPPCALLRFSPASASHPLDPRRGRFRPRRSDVQSHRRHARALL